MKKISYSDFKENMEKVFDSVHAENVAMIKTRKGKTIILMSEQEYNSIQETLYLESTKANRKRLQRAADQISGFEK